MPDANNPQGGSPSSPEDKVVAPNNNELGIFHPAKTLQKDGDFNTYSRYTSRNPQDLRRFDGIRKKEVEAVEAEAALLFEAKVEREKKLFLVESLFNQLENAAWEVPELPEKKGELLEIKKGIGTVKSLDGFTGLDIRIAEIKSWAESAVAIIRESELEENIQKKLKEVKNQEWFKQLEARTAKLDPAPSYQTITKALNDLAWLKDDDGFTHYSGEISDVEKQLSKVEALIQAAEEKIRTTNEKELIKKTIEEQLRLITLQTSVSRRYNALSGKVDRLRAALANPKISIFGLQPLVGEYDNCSYLNTDPSLDQDQIQFAADQLKVMENKIRLAIEDLEKQEQDLAHIELSTSKSRVRQAERTRQESLHTWRAEWPNVIKRLEKKEGRVGRPGEDGGWKRDGRRLPNQILWDKLSTQAIGTSMRAKGAGTQEKGAFEKYNSLISKALSQGKEEELRDMIATKEAVIDAIYGERPEDAIRELTRLERMIESGKDAIENSVERKRIQSEYDKAVFAFEQITQTLSDLEKSWIESKKTEADKIFVKLASDDIKSDPTKSKQFLHSLDGAVQDFATTISERKKKVDQSVRLRIEKFEDYTGKLKELELALTTTLSSLPTEEKEALKKKITDVESEAKKFIDHNAAKEYGKADAVLALFKAELDELAEEATAKLSTVKTAKAEQKEKDAKAQEKARVFNQEFKDAQSYFKKLKEELVAMNVSGQDKAAFDKRTKELDDLLNEYTESSQKVNANKGELKEKIIHFKNVLGEFSTFVIQKIGKPSRIKSELDYLEKRLGATPPGDTRTIAQLQNRIKDLKKAGERIEEFEKAYEKINGGDRKRPVVLRTPKDDWTIIIPGKKDPLTGRSKEMSVKEWGELHRKVDNKEANAERERLKEAELIKWEQNPNQYLKEYKEHTWLPGEEQLQSIKKEIVETLGFLRETHMKMWEQNPAVYKELYSQRVWGVEDKMTVAVVESVVKEKIPNEAERALWKIEPDIIRRAELLKLNESGELSKEELDELRGLEERVVKKLRQGGISNDTLQKWAMKDAPSYDENLAWIIVDGVKRTSKEERRAKLAEYRRALAAKIAKNDNVPGITTQASGGVAASVTETDITNNQALAKAVLPSDVKASSNNLSRSISPSEPPTNNHERKAQNEMQKLNKGAEPVAPHTAPLSAQEQQKVRSRIESMMEDLTRHIEKNLRGPADSVKKYWRMFLYPLILVAGSTAGMYAQAETINSTAQAARTLKDVLDSSNFEQFVGGINPEGAKNWSQFLKDLTGK